MNNMYPAFIDLKNKRCLIVGGGKIAFQKIKPLIEAKANITIISERISSQIEQLKEAYKNINFIKRSYKKGDLKDFFIVIGATNAKKTNKLIHQESTKNNILCNIVDQPDKCNFFVPAVYINKDLKIAISTNGKCPALAKKIKQELADIYSPDLAKSIKQLDKLRKRLKKTEPNITKRSQILSKLISEHEFHKISESEMHEFVKEIKETTK